LRKPLLVLLQKSSKSRWKQYKRVLKAPGNGTVVIVNLNGFWKHITLSPMALITSYVVELAALRKKEKETRSSPKKHNYLFLKSLK
jgi:hypothetical protein